MTYMHKALLPMFSLDMHHLYRFEGDEWRFAYQTNGTVTFSAIEDPHKKLTYEIETLSRLSGAGKIEVIPFGLMPKHLRPLPVNESPDLFLSGLPVAKRRRLESRHAMVQGYIKLRGENRFKVADDAITAAMPEICQEAEAYLAETLPDPEQDLKLAAWKAGEGPKPRSKLRTEALDAPSARTLRKWVAAFEARGKFGLLDNRERQGNRNSYFNVEEMTLMAKTINAEYLHIQRKTIATVVKDVKRAFREENEKRRAEGKAPLRVPGREAVRKFVNGLDKFRVLVARFGHQEAMKRMRPVKEGLQADRPLQIVSMDEMKIDLLLLLSKSGLLSLITSEDTEQLEKLVRTSRWWLTAAIDYRTRCILGMVLSANPKTTAAIKCLRMVTSDKGQFVDAVGALEVWSMYGTPETLFVDNGSAFKSYLFTNTCADLGITKVQTIAGQPGMRGKMERVFNTLQSSLLPRLSGRTFGDVVTRANHPAEDRACLDVEDFAYVLVRWVVDVYHNTPHEGLGGRTPRQQWDADMAAGNYPLMAAPSLRRKRIAFGLPLTRKVQKDGIRVMNVRYTSRVVAEQFLRKSVHEVQVRWLDENIGSIEVEVDGTWHEVPAVSDIFEGVDATTWEATRRALRARDKDSKEWNETVVFKAIKDIEALNANRKAAYGIIDHGWNEKRFAAAEREALMNFDIVETRETLMQPADGHGRVIVPVEPPRPSPIADAVRDAKSAKPSKNSWSLK